MKARDPLPGDRQRGDLPRGEDLSGRIFLEHFSSAGPVTGIFDGMGIFFRKHVRQPLPRVLPLHRDQQLAGQNNARPSVGQSYGWKIADGRNHRILRFTRFSL
jgi:hypothetical protein